MADSELTVLSLCSGVGGLELGLQAGCDYLGLRTHVVGYVERDAYAASVLLARMEDEVLEPAPIWCGDLGELPAGELPAIDCISAGIPCQPFSAAGKRQGLADERWLWPVVARLVRQLRPRYVFLENVPPFTLRGLGPVLADLAEAGFDAEWDLFSAAEVGAPHKRERLFLLAIRGDSVDDTLLGRHRQPHGEVRARRDGAVAAGEPGMADADSVGLERTRLHVQPRGSRSALHDSGWSVEDVADAEGDRRGQGRADPPGRREGTGTKGTGVGSADDCGSGLADAERSGCGSGEREPQERPWQPDVEGGRVFPPGPAGDWANIPEHLAPSTESGVRVLVDGVAVVVDTSRADQLRCVGNGVVPLTAAVAFVELARRLGVA